MPFNFYFFCSKTKTTSTPNSSQGTNNTLEVKINISPSSPNQLTPQPPQNTETPTSQAKLPSLFSRITSCCGPKTRTHNGDYRLHHDYLPVRFCCIKYDLRKDTDFWDRHGEFSRKLAMNCAFAFTFSAIILFGLAFFVTLFLSQDKDFRDATADIPFGFVALGYIITAFIIAGICFTNMGRLSDKYSYNRSVDSGIGGGQAR